MRRLVAAFATLLALAMAVVLLVGVDGQLGCASAGAAGGTPGASGTPVAGGAPAALVPVFQGAAAAYNLGGEGASILAGINGVESDFDRSNLPGVHSGANYAGAEGPMQFERGTWARYRVQGPGGAAPPNVYNEIDAVYSAANYLHASGAPANWASAIFSYNHATWYVNDVLADAQTYDTGCQAPIPTVPGATAVILPDGDAEAPAQAPQAVQEMIAAGNRIDHFAYSYGGGHGDPAKTMNQADPDPAAVPGEQENGAPGYDCSSATSYVLWGAGLGETLLGGQVEDSSDLERVGDPGPGKWVTIFASQGHAYVEVAGIYLDTAAGIGRPPNPPRTGPRWSPVGSGPDGFTARHPPGL